VILGFIFQLRGATLYTWYRNCISGYIEAKASGEFGKDNFVGIDKKEKYVPILKAENMGAHMTVDEKMIDEEYFTILTNAETGKVALLAETMNVAKLTTLMDKMGDAKQKVKTITADLSPTYEKFCEQNFTNAILVADKFHVVKHIVEAVQSLRIRIKQEEIAKIPLIKKERKLYEKKTKLINGESRIEMLTRSRYLLFKEESKWSESQKRRAPILFETYPLIKLGYDLTIQIRQWLNKKNIGKLDWQVERELIHWYDNAETAKLPEIENLIRIIGSHEDTISNYFITGKTNALAEAINSKIQRFINTNFGVRDKDFFMFRLAKYFS
jgi:transposase